MTAQRIAGACERTFYRIAVVACALALHFAAGLCIAAGDADLTPIPDRSPLTGRLGAIGIVTVGEEGRINSMGTGVLVSACHVITAGHVLTPAGGRLRDGMTAHFVPAMGNVSVTLSERAVRGRVVAAGKSPAAGVAASGFEMQNTANDWALIELDRPLANIEPLKMLYPGAAPDAATPLSAAGYTPNPRLTFLSVHENCTVRHDFQDSFPGILVANCAVRKGMSGGPLLIDTGAQLILAGIIVERVEVGSKISAIAVSTRAFGDKVAAAMRSSEICAAGMPFALTARAHESPGAAVEK